MPIPSLSENQLQATCDVLGDTDSGLTGSQIGRLLAQCRIEDVGPLLTKRFRLYEALSAKQRQDGCANNVVGFIQASLDPVTYTGNQEVFDARRERVNTALAFAGLHVGEDGRVRDRAAARTLTEAEERAGRLRRELLRRNVHSEVLHFCQPDLLDENYFHAVLEASKSVFERIRTLTELTSDSAALVDEAFGMGGGRTPHLAFNSLRTETERSEHTGLMNLMKGLAGAFRNPSAHAPKITWPIVEQEALDILTLVSMLHRRLDAAVVTQPAAP